VNFEIQLQKFFQGGVSYIIMLYFAVDVVLSEEVMVVAESLKMYKINRRYCAFQGVRYTITRRRIKTRSNN